MSEVRYAERVVFSTDDSAVPVTISYPAPLRPHELQDLRAFLDVWLRSQERRSLPTPESTK